MAEQVLMRFEGLKDRVIPADLFGGAWPMPDCILVKPAGDDYLFGDGSGGETPPDATAYRKVGQSQITDEQIATMTHVLRGAQYERETP